MHGMFRRGKLIALLDFLHLIFQKYKDTKQIHKNYIFIDCCEPSIMSIGLSLIGSADNMFKFYSNRLKAAPRPQLV